MANYWVWSLLFFSLSSFAASEQYHVCTDPEGRKTFTSQPCADDESAEVRTYRRSAGSSSSQRLSTDNPIYQQMKADNRRAEILRAKKQHRNNIEAYSNKMSKELAVLRAKKARANNNLAGAAWESSISEEMNSVTTKYTTLIDVERDRLSDLDSELAGL